MWRRSGPLFLVCLIAAGCEASKGPVLMDDPRPSPIRLARSDPGFRLSAEERASVVPGFDLDALERLLQMATPEFRAQLLPYFQHPKAGERRGMLTRIEDPALQEVLEEVYAPMWDTLSDEMLDDSSPPYMPGREIARKRREERRRIGAQQPSPGTHP